jgi:hypothetical protein
LGVSLGPQAKVMQRLRPRLASTVVSEPGIEAFWKGGMFSSSCRTIETGPWWKLFLLKIGTILAKVEEGGGGLGVLVRVPGLVQPPSLVSSAIDVVLVVLQVEADDSPRRKAVVSANSSVGEGSGECNADVNRDVLRSLDAGAVFSNAFLNEICRTIWERETLEWSGGSSTSATTSSSSEYVVDPTAVEVD